MFLIWCANIGARIFIEKKCSLYDFYWTPQGGDERKKYCKLLSWLKIIIQILNILARLQHHMKQGQKVVHKNVS